MTRDGMAGRNAHPTRDEMSTLTDHTTEELLINMGPQHPSTHGVLRLVLSLDGEKVIRCVPHIGYLHSSLEKIAESRTYAQVMPFTDRFDYLSSMSNNLCYALAVEQLLGLTVPPRCQWIRVLMAEVQRIASHLVWLGTYGLDLGAVTIFLYCFREREQLIDLFEAVSGQRLLYNYLRIGGLRNDLTPDFLDRLEAFLGYFPERIEEYDRLLSTNRIFLARTRGIGPLSREDAIAWAVSGPNARGSGVNVDLRRTDPYLTYPEIEFDVPVREEGDALARYLVRVEEMRQSIRILHQCIARLRELAGEPIEAEGVPRTIRPPAGDVYVRTESPRGELGCYLVSDGGPQPVRMHWRAPSFANLAALPLMAEGGLIADIVATLGSIDIVLPDVDR